MAKQDDGYDYHDNGKYHWDTTAMRNDRESVFSSMSEFNSRFEDLFRGREDCYNLNGDIYYKGKKVRSAGEYIPDTKVETITKKGTVKRRNKRRTNSRIVILSVVLYLLFGIASYLPRILPDIDFSDINLPDISLPGDSDRDEIQSSDYDAVKKKLNMPEAEPVTNPGEINVCGSTFYLGMTLSDVEDLGYQYDEYRNEESGEIESIAAYYPMDIDTYGMVSCYIVLKDGGDKDNPADYIVQAIYTGYWYDADDEMKLYYNTEIFHGIKSDMPVEELKAVLSQMDENWELYMEGEYPYANIFVDNMDYTIWIEDGRVASISMYQY